MTGRYGPGDVLAAWASALLGAERAAEVAPSLAERAGHLEQLRHAGLWYDDEPATRFAPDPDPGEDGR